MYIRAVESRRKIFLKNLKNLLTDSGYGGIIKTMRDTPPTYRKGVQKMTYNDIIKTITGTTKGSFHTMRWSKELKTRKGIQGISVTKETVATVRFGVGYDNMKAVQVKRENGILPEQNQGLPWGTWKQYPYTIEHKGNTYIRAALTPNANIKTVYRLNGIEVDKETLANIVLKSELESRKGNDVLAVNTDNVIEIK